MISEWKEPIGVNDIKTNKRRKKTSFNDATNLYVICILRNIEIKSMSLYFTFFYFIYCFFVLFFVCVSLFTEYIHL